MKTILFICTGNVCRSPMAEALFLQCRAKAAVIFRMLSAGTRLRWTASRRRRIPCARCANSAWTSPGNAAACFDRRSRSARRISHRHDPRPRGHDRAAVPGGGGAKLFCSANSTSRSTPTKRTFGDPIGSPYEIYVDCRDQIEQGIASLLKYMEQHAILSTGTSPIQTAAVRNFAIGAGSRRL